MIKPEGPGGFEIPQQPEKNGKIQKGHTPDHDYTVKSAQDTETKVLKETLKDIKTEEKTTGTETHKISKSKEAAKTAKLEAAKDKVLAGATEKYTKSVLAARTGLVYQQAVKESALVKGEDGAMSTAIRKTWEKHPNLTENDVKNIIIKSYDLLKNEREIDPKVRGGFVTDHVSLAKKTILQEKANLKMAQERAENLLKDPGCKFKDEDPKYVADQFLKLIEKGAGSRRLDHRTMAMSILVPGVSQSPESQAKRVSDLITANRQLADRVAITLKRDPKFKDVDSQVLKDKAYDFIKQSGMKFEEQDLIVAMRRKPELFLAERAQPTQVAGKKTEEKLQNTGQEALLSKALREKYPNLDNNEINDLIQFVQDAKINIGLSEANIQHVLKTDATAKQNYPMLEKKDINHAQSFILPHLVSRYSDNRVIAETLEKPKLAAVVGDVRRSLDSSSLKKLDQAWAKDFDERLKTYSYCKEQIPNLNERKMEALTDKAWDVNHGTARSPKGFNASPEQLKSAMTKVLAGKDERIDVVFFGRELSQELKKIQT